ncbi:MAG: DedA family protein, partial [Phormidesmis sp. CAN_BIN44]|nr:DedA family protein [Phormidesmis sp. CAN_BIN44]
KWVGISGADIDKANRWFYRHGNKAVLFCRLVPGVRTLISLPAGISEMRLAPFLVYSTIGTTIWVTILTYAGHLLGEHYDRVDDYLAPVSKIVLGGLIVALIVWVVRRKQIQRVK